MKKKKKKCCTSTLIQELQVTSCLEKVSENNPNDINGQGKARMFLFCFVFFLFFFCFNRASHKKSNYHDTLVPLLFFFLSQVHTSQTKA